MGTMHVGHALLTKLLAPLLERGGGAAPAARIVSVASEASHAARPWPASFYVLGAPFYLLVEHRRVLLLTS